MRSDSNVFYKWFYWLKSYKRVFDMPELGVDISKKQVFSETFPLVDIACQVGSSRLAAVKQCFMGPHFSAGVRTSGNSAQDLFFCHLNPWCGFSLCLAVVVGVKAAHVDACHSLKFRRQHARDPARSSEGVQLHALLSFLTLAPLYYLS